MGKKLVEFQKHVEEYIETKRNASLGILMQNRETVDALLPKWKLKGRFISELDAKYKEALESEDIESLLFREWYVLFLGSPFDDLALQFMAEAEACFASEGNTYFCFETIEHDSDGVPYGPHGLLDDIMLHALKRWDEEHRDVYRQFWW